MGILLSWPAGEVLDVYKLLRPNLPFSKSRWVNCDEIKKICIPTMIRTATICFKRYRDQARKTRGTLTDIYITIIMFENSMKLDRPLQKSSPNNPLISHRHICI